MTDTLYTIQNTIYLIGKWVPAILFVALVVLVVLVVIARMPRD